MKRTVTIILVILLAIGWYSTLTASKTKAEEIETHLQNAERYAGKGIYVDAVEEYKKALEYDPDNGSILMRMAHTYKYMGKDSEYISTLQEIVNKGNDCSSVALDELMKYWTDNNSTDLAVSYIKSLYSDNPETEYVMAWYKKLKGSYYTLYSHYSALSEIFNNNMVVKDDGLYGIVDAEGEEILKPEWIWLTPYSSDGYAGAVDSKNRNIFIDKEGQTRIVPGENYENIGMLINGMITASEKGKYGFLNADGEKATEFEWDDITAFNGIALAEKSERWAIIDKTGTSVTDFTYEDVIRDIYNISCRQGRVFVKQNGRYMIIDKEGNEISDNKYDDAKCFNENGYAAVCLNGKWGYVDNEGNQVINCVYDDAESFSNGYAAVCLNGKWGYIDNENDIVIPAQFSKATAFSDKGTAAVTFQDDNSLQEKWKLIKLMMAD